jgi:toxin ParE1/3/4
VKPGILIRPQAQAEIDDHAEYIARDSPEAARRFLVAAQQTFEMLHGMPQMGALWESPDPRLRGVRRHPIRDFKNYLVFYRPAGHTIDVLHVFHGAQNITDLLGDEEDNP